MLGRNAADMLILEQNNLSQNGYRYNSLCEHSARSNDWDLQNALDPLRMKAYLLLWIAFTTKELFDIVKRWARNACGVKRLITLYRRARSLHLV